MKYKINFFNYIFIFILSIVVICPSYGNGIGKIYFPKPKEITPTKTPNTPGLWKVYSSANTNGFGVLGPDTATTNIYLKPTEETPGVGENYIRLGTPSIQNVDGISSTVIPFTYETLPVLGVGSININGSSVTDPNFISTSDITITNNSGQVSCVVDQITLSKLSAASVITTAEMNVTDDTTIDDNSILTAGATYAMISQIFGLPNLIITSPLNNAWIQSNTASFAGTASDETSITLIEWKLESGGTYANAIGTTSWSQAGPWGSDGTNKTAYFRATDNEGNQIVKAVKFNLDTVNPIIVAGTDGVHNGIGTVVGTCVLNETNPSVVSYTVVNATPASGTCSGSYPNYTTPALTPTGTGNITITYSTVDLSGRNAIGTDLIQQFLYQ